MNSHTKAIAALAPLALLAACATTTAGRSAANATPEERARCEAMAEAMGTAPRHSHAEQKGVAAQSPMNREHARCREILAQPR